MGMANTNVITKPNSKPPTEKRAQKSRATVAATKAGTTPAYAVEISRELIGAADR